MARTGRHRKRDPGRESSAVNPTGRTSPHPALLQTDILHEICSHLKPLATDKLLGHSGLNSLARCARISRAFHEPALRALWWALPSIREALELFSAFELVHTDRRRDSWDEDSDCYCLFTQEISQKEWERFRRYAGYVRIIREEPPHYLVQPSVFLYLSCLCGGQPLFPNLRELTWRAMTLHHTELILLATPTLRKLVMELKYESPDDTYHVEATALDTLLRMTTSQLSGLQELAILSGEYHRAPSNLFALTSIPQLRHLRILHLDCDITDDDFLATLAALPDLAELNIALDLDLDPPTPHKNSFAALRKLTVRSFRGSPDNFPGVFASPNLDTLSITLQGTPWPPALALLHTSATRYRRLRSLTFSVAGYHADFVSTAPNIHTLLNPLLHASAIEEFAFDVSAPVVFESSGGNQELIRLAKAWPQLRSLEFIVTLSRGVEPQPLVAFAQHCPDLRTLRFRAINFENLTDEQLNAAPVYNHELRILDACTACIGTDGATRAAALLHRLFPHLVVWTIPDCMACDLRYFSHGEDLRRIKHLASRQAAKTRVAGSTQVSVA
ncbi:hypothetical protein OH77DRAFT_1058555 [Trametes cingulata]|nr:hypothetical protein OH77DRAFT_1058555 [Trametes cingulata]